MLAARPRPTFGRARVIVASAWMHGAAGVAEQAVADQGVHDHVGWRRLVSHLDPEPLDDVELVGGHRSDSA